MSRAAWSGLRYYREEEGGGEGEGGGRMEGHRGKVREGR